MLDIVVQVSSVILVNCFLSDGANDMECNDFKEEIKVMKDIGFHRNIVNLIGCCTAMAPFCLVIEYMENGDLLHYLKNRRTKV